MWADCISEHTAGDSTQEGTQRADANRSILEDHEYREFRSQVAQKKCAVP